MTKFSKLKIIILFSIFYFLFSLQASAASLNLVSPVPEIGTGQEFRVDLMLDTESQDVNATQGKIVFPKNSLELKEIIDGNSVINLWVEKPKLYILNSESYVSFSGVIPGGFSGVLSPYYKGEKPGKVFSLVFVAKTEGIGSIEIKDAKVLLNDGKGTPAELRIMNYELRIMGLPIPNSQFLIPDSKKDADPPELFTPEISRDPNIFNGRWFLVFAAQDKGSGIDYYAIHESARTKEAARINTKDWTVVESPYILKDQKLRSYIYIKAVDKAGNERFAVLPPKFAPWYKKPIVDIILGLIGLIVLLLIVRWLLKLRNKKH